MFARLFAVAALAAFVVAQECNTGSINCCNNVYQAQDAHNALKQVGINDLAGLTGLVGTGCTPISGIGALNSGASCTSQPICCNDNKMNGLVVVGCSPINA